MSSEIVHVLPLVRPRARVAHLELAKQLLVPVGHCGECDASAGFDNWLRMRVKHNYAVDAISHSQLLAEDNEGAVRAVTQEHT